jgi:hypothetical protein
VRPAAAATDESGIAPTKSETNVAVKRTRKPKKDDRQSSLF